MGKPRSPWVEAMPTIDAPGPAVFEIGGSQVEDGESYQMLLDRARVIWLTASPETHLRRVREQGDLYVNAWCLLINWAQCAPFEPDDVSVRAKVHRVIGGPIPRHDVARSAIDSAAISASEYNIAIETRVLREIHLVIESDPAGRSG